jgi:hypothetical protein
MRHARGIPQLILLAIALSSCTDAIDQSYDASVRRHAAAPATPEHMSAILDVSRPARVDGGLRWTILTSLSPEDWYPAVQTWNTVESRPFDLQAQPTALAYVEISQESAIERAELAAALEKTGLLLQQFALIDLGNHVRGYAIECTGLT